MSNTLERKADHENAPVIYCPCGEADCEHTEQEMHTMAAGAIEQAIKLTE